jgi:aminodeoxyfutalosine synthase
LVNLIKQAKREPIERDTLYNVVNDYSKTPIESIVDASLN